jgi:hypothetical protein
MRVPGFMAEQELFDNQCGAPICDLPSGDVTKDPVFLLSHGQLNGPLVAPHECNFSRAPLCLFSVAS